MRCKKYWVTASLGNSQEIVDIPEEKPLARDPRLLLNSEVKRVIVAPGKVIVDRTIEEIIYEPDGSYRRYTLHFTVPFSSCSASRLTRDTARFR